MAFKLRSKSDTTLVLKIIFLSYYNIAMRKSSNSVNEYFYILNLKIYVTEKISYRFTSISFQAALSLSIRLELQDNSGQINKLTTALKTK